MLLTKHCPRCYHSKPLKDFNKGTGQYKRADRCKDCELKGEKGAGWTQPSEVNPVTGYEKWVYHKYGLTVADVMVMYEKQNGRCAICRLLIILTLRKRRRGPDTACVDHCHKTGKPRGLLCPRCNSGIAVFLDSPRALRSAADYLEKPPIKQ